MNAEWKPLLFSLLGRLFAAGVLILLGTSILLSAGPAGALIGLGLLLAASIVLAVPIANLIATEARELSFEATAALRKMRRRPSILAACFTQAELWP